MAKAVMNKQRGYEKGINNGQTRSRFGIEDYKC